MEKKIALVPRVIMKGAMGVKEYALLLTDQRLMFVLEHASKAAIVGALGDVLMSDRKVVDYEGEDLEKIASDSSNIVVRHSSIQSIGIEKGFSSYTLSTMFTLLVDFQDSRGKPKKVKAFLQPSQALVKEKKTEGLNRKSATEEYARTVKSALEKSLPLALLQKGEWSV